MISFVNDELRDRKSYKVRAAILLDFCFEVE